MNCIYPKCLRGFVGAEQGRSVGDTKEASIEALLNKSL